MMYRISIPRSRKSIIDIMDGLMLNKQMVLPDVKTNRVLGHYVRPWRDKGFISIFNEDVQHVTIASLNIPGLEKRDGRRVEYVFDDRLLSSLNVRLPRL